MRLCARVLRIQGVIDATTPNTRVIKHSIVIAGHRTSISLEDAFWNALKEIANDEDLSLATLVAQIDAAHLVGASVFLIANEFWRVDHDLRSLHRHARQAKIDGQKLHRTDNKTDGDKSDDAGGAPEDPAS